ncbi:MAG: serine hydrolase [Candidatus Omnitrophota bacterium]
MRKIRFVFIFFCVFLFLGASGYHAYTGLSSYAQVHKNFQTLQDRVDVMVENFSGECAFIIKDIKHPSCEISRNQNRMFPAASLIKLPLAAVAFKAVKENKISLEQTITIERKDITGGSGILKTKVVPITMTFQELIETMIAHSDNTASNKIIGLLGYEYINDGFKGLGLKGTILRRKMMDFSMRRKGVENYITAADTVYLLEKIYKKELIDIRSSELMMAFLREQKIKDRIPRYLPKQVDVAHKTGLERGVVHDAGIIFSPRSDFVICVLTKRVKSYSKAKKFIARLSLLTYNRLCIDN